MRSHRHPLRALITQALRQRRRAAARLAPHHAAPSPFRRFAAPPWGFLPLLALFFSATAHAQLDRLLAPLSAKAAAASQTVEAIPSPAPADAPQTLTGAALVAEIEKELRAKLGLAGELKLTLAQPWKTQKLPGADFSVAIIESPASGISGTFMVRVKVSSDGQLVGDWQVPLRAQLWQEVWVAATRLDRGQSLERSLLAVQKVDVLRERTPLLLAEVDPAAFEIVQTVTASRPLTQRDVIARPLVRRGQVVEVVANHGQLAITMKAQALESGAAGELIKLRNLQSRKEFSAQILNENKVQVHF